MTSRAVGAAWILDSLSRTNGGTVTNYDRYMAFKRQTYGDRFVPPAGAETFAPYLHTGQRVRIHFSDHRALGRDDRYGTIGITSGWAPAFLLMHNTRARGSSTVLGPKDTIVALKIGRRYVNV